MSFPLTSAIKREVKREAVDEVSGTEVKRARIQEAEASDDNPFIATVNTALDQYREKNETEKKNLRDKVRALKKELKHKEQLSQEESEMRNTEAKQFQQESSGLREAVENYRAYVEDVQETIKVRDNTIAGLRGSLRVSNDILQQMRQKDSEFHVECNKTISGKDRQFQRIK